MLVRNETHHFVDVDVVETFCPDQIWYGRDINNQVVINASYVGYTSIAINGSRK
jgi:hypothetical protein